MGKAAAAGRIAGNSLETSAARRGFTAIAAWAALFCSILIVYWPALGGQLVWDDASHVTKPELQPLHGLWRIWSELGATQQYYPVLHSAFWFEHRLWGDAVLGYHLVNVILHAISACLVVWIVRRLALPGAWFAGFLFALHPACVEAVAWISEQKSTLSGVFCLGALLVYLAFDQSRSRRTYLLAFGLFVLALLSKSVTATLPAVLLVIFWWRRGRIEWRRDVLPMVPWFLLAAPMGLFTSWVERAYIGARGSEFSMTVIERALIAGRALWFYAAKLFLPINLMFSYPRWKIDAAAWWQYLFPLGVLAVAMVLIVVARRNRGPLAGLLIFAGTLFPVLGFFNVLPFRYSWVADHFQYLASLAIIVPMAAWLTLCARRRFSGSPARAVTVAAALVAVLGILSLRQSAIYRDEETLYRETLSRNPTSWLAHNNLATILETRPGGLEEAVAEYKTAVALAPKYAQAHFNLASAYSLMDTPESAAGAIAQYHAAIALKDDYAEAHSNLCNLLARVPDRMEEAIAECRRAVEIQPDSPQMHANLGNLLAQTPDRLPEAVREFETAVRLNPKMAELRCNLGTALSQTPGRLPDAIGQFQAALAIDPGLAQAHFLLGMVLAQVPGRTEEAIAELQATLRLRPDFEPAQQALQQILGQR